VADHPSPLILRLKFWFAVAPVESLRIVRRMMRPSTAAKPSRFRALIASLLFCSVAFAIGLSAAPQLHDALHKGERATHECAATLLSSGTWEHSALEPVLAAPIPAPHTVRFIDIALRFAARPRTSILEHAPPALS
jgi:hypothetical protein